MLNETQFQTLKLICDTLAPSLAVAEDVNGFYWRSASDLDVPAQVRAVIEEFGEPALQRDLGWMLSLLEAPLFNSLFSGIQKAFSDMDLEERTRTLLSWSESNLPSRRKAFQGLKRLALFFFYTLPDKTGRNPNWPVIGYEIPYKPKSVEKTLHPLMLRDDLVIDTDVVIVGSGAGGSVVAAELAGAHLEVVILEKGDYFNETDYDGHERRSLERMFERSGFLASRDLGITLLAGSTLGGGTTINWCTSLHPPAHVLEEWARDFHLPAMLSPEFQQSLDTVSQRINVNTDESEANPQNQKLETGAQRLGYRVEPIPRNVRGCQDCGFCNYGCVYGAKQGTLKNYLPDAYQDGAEIITQASVDRILIERGRAVGVTATVRSEEARYHLTVRAKVVVIAGGALHTPAILMRSGLSNAHIGRNLHLHPTSVIYGLYEEPICGWSGVIMSRVVREFANLDSEGYGVLLETPPIHPGLAAMSMSWRSGAQHKSIMTKLKNLASTIVLTRDRDGGVIKLDRQGQPLIEYSLSREDSAKLLFGITEALRIQHAAGAYEISAPYNMPYLYRPRQSRQSLEEFLNSIHQRGLQTNRFALMSAHQMSTARMAGSPRLGAINPAGETFEVKNLYVADASTFPTASGVNPMLTIMAMAHHIARGLKARFA